MLCVKFFRERVGIDSHFVGEGPQHRVELFDLPHTYMCICVCLQSEGLQGVHQMLQNLLIVMSNK